MVKQRVLKILDKDFHVTFGYIDIHDLLYFRSNPRILACTLEIHGFNDMHLEQQQEEIHKVLLREQSVKTLLSDVEKNHGLMEPILVRYDSKEVIEGNSRLAVYRELHRRHSEKDEWTQIPCDILSKLKEEEQAALLNQLHVKGKSQWSAYAKAYYAYGKKLENWTLKKTATIFGESVSTISKRIKTIELMEESKDTNLSHFSYYEVATNKKEIAKALSENDSFKSFFFDKIRNLGSEEESNTFTAIELRKKLPSVLKRPKALKKFLDGTCTLEQAYEIAKISSIDKKVKQATDLIDGISKEGVTQLEASDFKKLKYDARKLSKTVERFNAMIESVIAG